MNSSRHRILYVEDNHDTCEMVATLLGFSNIEVVTAHTASSGLYLAQRVEFHLYLLDARLPDKCGLELCRELRALHPTTPIIFISGLAHEHDRQRALTCGAEAYLTKPVEMAELKQVVLQMLGGWENAP